ncbi:hypothetical protein [uncultured Clostridium sp.]|jgi:hypothetical protein|uniref:hypothetical protein n=1 Tax=uncultured Clostridium sp. TaxID=59620 RepID=UPI0025D9E3E2|nr:hypothetical protein [uncultured Clostridium sp.]
MSAILNDAMKYIDQYQKAYSVTVDEPDKMRILNIDEFVNDCTDIYFVVYKDAKNMEDNSMINVYFESKVKKYKLFKSICVSGKLTKIVYPAEIYRVLKTLTHKNKGRYIQNGSLKNYAVYKLKAEYVNLLPNL